MSTPAYVARKIGDEFVLVRVDTGAVVLRIGEATVGCLMLGYAATHRGLCAALTGLAGAALAYHGFTGRDPIARLLHTAGPQHGRPSQTPSHPGAKQASTGVQVPADELEEAQMESFPASDPPASIRREAPPA
jgi:hypothetical protein